LRLLFRRIGIVGPLDIVRICHVTSCGLRVTGYGVRVQ
jgi:hypothetical protein